MNPGPITFLIKDGEIAQIPHNHFIFLNGPDIHATQELRRQRSTTRKAGKSISELVFMPEVEELLSTLTSLVLVVCFLSTNHDSRNKFKRYDNSK